MSYLPYTGTSHNDEPFDYPEPNLTAVNTLKKLDAFLTLIPLIHPSTDAAPQLAWDCEGVNLGRHGSLTHITLGIRSLNQFFCFDYHVLGREMLDLQGKSGQSLRTLLQDPNHMHIWNDPRGDQDALKTHCGITLPADSVRDIQLLGLAVLDGGQTRDRRRGLSDAILQEGPDWMSPKVLADWYTANRDGKAFFSQNGYGEFAKRPMNKIAWRYAIGDVTQLFNLYDNLAPKQTGEMRDMIRGETKRSLKEVMSADWKSPQDGSAPKCFRSLPVEPEEGWVSPAGPPAEDWEAGHMTKNGYSCRPARSSTNPYGWQC
ncbi:hypothetical protein IFR05_004973 [Cadophora sp. M221]|nr:hypothetical protein IFR05_004973 [Cadophora sp. M221]